jgi:hypothetical protein
MGLSAPVRKTLDAAVTMAMAWITATALATAAS